MKVSKLAVVRIRGSVDIRKEVEDTLQMLRLLRPNHCTLTDDDSSKRGMLQRSKEILTWGPVKSEVLENIIRRRGELEGGEPVTDEGVEKKTSYADIGEFSKAVCDGDADLDDLEGLKKVFRLRPPKKGYRNVRRSFNQSGSLGDRGVKINDLLQRMI